MVVNATSLCSYIRVRFDGFTRHPTLVTLCIFPRYFKPNTLHLVQAPCAGTLCRYLVQEPRLFGFIDISVGLHYAQKRHTNHWQQLE